MPRRRIEVLTFDGCPNALAAHALVNRVVADLDVEAEAASVRVPGAARRRPLALGGGSFPAATRDRGR
jgi:hypothetical protein